MGAPKAVKKPPSPSDSSDDDRKSKSAKEVKTKPSIINTIFKQKKNRESSNPRDSAVDKEDKKLNSKSKKHENKKDSPRKKKKKELTPRERSISLSSDDSWQSPSSRKKISEKQARSPAKVERPPSSSSGEILTKAKSDSSPSPKMDRKGYASSSSSRSRSRSPALSPAVAPVPIMMSPMAMSEDEASLQNKQRQSKGSSGRMSRKDQAAKRSKEEKLKKEEVKEEKPDLTKISSFKGEPSRREKIGVKARAGSLSEDEVSSCEGGAEPYCQAQHMPHPSLAELRDKNYFTRLQAIQIAINNPATSGQVLNSIVETILETGNFSLDQDNFNFDICNLDPVTVGKIESVLKSH